MGAGGAGSNLANAEGHEMASVTPLAKGGREDAPTGRQDRELMGRTLHLKLFLIEYPAPSTLNRHAPVTGDASTRGCVGGLEF